MTQNSILEVDVDRLEEQLPDLLDELLRGSGAVVIRQALTPEQVAESRRVIMLQSEADADKETHFHGGHQDQIHLQRRVWNLLDKGEIFEEIVQLPPLVRIAAAFLGNQFILGSIAANRLLPGGPGQEPHVDYPYWDLYDRESFPMAINSSFPLNLQATYPLDPFTPESGASAWLPGSQRELRYPDETDRSRFDREARRMTGDPGDCVIFNGQCWHCAMPNESDHERSAVLIEFLPKFVTPLEDQKLGVRQEVKDRASPLLRQLMGLVYPYPKLFDEAEATVQIGRDLLE